MNKSTKTIIIGSLLALPTLCSAQFNLGINPDGRTNNNIRSVGIGGFTPFNRPKANLNVNQLLMPNSPFFTPGHLFRTDGTNSAANIWSLYTGANANSVTEKFRLFVPANSNDVVVKATSGKLILADNKNRITLFEIIQLQKEVATLRRQVDSLKAKRKDK